MYYTSPTHSSAATAPWVCARSAVGMGRAAVFSVGLSRLRQALGWIRPNTVQVFFFFKKNPLRVKNSRNSSKLPKFVEICIQFRKLQSKFCFNPLKQNSSENLTKSSFSP
jgi:hypothetical protein